MKTFIFSKGGKPVGIAQASTKRAAIARFMADNGISQFSDLVQSTREGEPDCGDVEALLGGIAGRLGVSMSAEFVPFSRSRNVAMESQTGEPWRSLNWRVTLSRNGRAVLTTDYGQGVGHCPAYQALGQFGKSASRPYEKGIRDKAADLEIETGKVARVWQDGNVIQPSALDVPPPSIGEVLQSLASDAGTIDEGTFEQWAESLGYSTDSRKAEATYRACLDIFTQLRAGIGDSALAEIRLAASFN